MMWVEREWHREREREWNREREREWNRERERERERETLPPFPRPSFAFSFGRRRIGGWIEGETQGHC